MLTVEPVEGETWCDRWDLFDPITIGARIGDYCEVIYASYDSAVMPTSVVTALYRKADDDG